jgi:pyruvate/2-oxoglutarate dehydrogenase complex dihydrolipoamide acyltransferase (E2) component
MAISMMMPALEVDAFSAIVTPAQTAVLDIGAVGDLVVAVKLEPNLRPIMTITLSSGHRFPGKAAARALSTRAGRTNQPARKMAESKPLPKILARRVEALESRRAQLAWAEFHPITQLCSPAGR